MQSTDSSCISPEHLNQSVHYSLIGQWAEILKQGKRLTEIWSMCRLFKNFREYKRCGICLDSLLNRKPAVLCYKKLSICPESRFRVTSDAPHRRLSVTFMWEMSNRSCSWCSRNTGKSTHKNALHLILSILVIKTRFFCFRTQFIWSNLILSVTRSYIFLVSINTFHRIENCFKTDMYLSSSSSILAKWLSEMDVVLVVTIRD